MVVPVEIVARGGSYVQGCPSQCKCKKKKEKNVLTCIPYIHYSNSCKGEEVTWLYRKKDVLCR